MEIYLEDHDKTVDDTEHIFKSAFEIIQNKFSKESGSFKIVDGKYGFVILKEKMKLPKIYNQEEVNACPVVNIIHDSEEETVSLQLRPKRKRKCKRLGTNAKEVVLSERIISKLYHDLRKKKNCDW